MGKLNNDTISIILYGLGVPTALITDKYGISELLERSIENTHLNLVRSSCIVRQYIITSGKSINSSRYKDLLYKHNPNSDLHKALLVLFDKPSQYNLTCFRTQYELIEQFKELNTNVETNLSIYLDSVYTKLGRYNCDTSMILKLFDFSHIDTYDQMLQYSEEILSNSEIFNKMPFRKMINLEPKELNYSIFANDESLFKFLYSREGKVYKESDIHNSTPINDDKSHDSFMVCSRDCGVEYVIDCENVDYTRVVSYLHSLSEDDIECVKCINVIDNTSSEQESIWDSLTGEVDIKVNHLKLGRVLDNKSRVDFNVYITAINILNSTKHNIILLASDSDYWSLISIAPERFMIGYEKEKIAVNYIQLLTDKGINTFNIALKCKDLGNVINEIVTDKVLTYLNSLNINIDTIVSSILKEYFVTNYSVKEPIYRDSIINSLHLTTHEGVLKFDVVNSAC